MQFTQHVRLLRMEPPFSFYLGSFSASIFTKQLASPSYIALIQATRGGHLFLIFISFSFLGFEGGIHH